MAKLFKNRTDNDIKNKWYAMQRKEKRIENKFRQELGIRLGGGSCSFSSGVDNKKDVNIGGQQQQQEEQQQPYCLGVTNNYYLHSSNIMEPTTFTTSVVNDSKSSNRREEEGEKHQPDMKAV